jgi:hypothetical protein
MDAVQAGLIPMHVGLPDWPPWWLVDGPKDERDAAPLSSIADVDIVDAVRTIYMRPDVRGAVNLLLPVFVEMISRDEEAARVLNDLVGGLTPPSGERVAPLLIYALAVTAGGAVGYWSR